MYFIFISSSMKSFSCSTNNYNVYPIHTDVARNFDWGAQNGKFCDVIMVTFFGDIMTMTSLKWRHKWFFEVRFRHNPLEKNKIWPHHKTLSHQNWRYRGTGNGESPALGDFWRFVTKIMYFRHISAKKPKTWNNISIGGRPGPLTLPGYALAHSNLIPGCMHVYAARYSAAPTKHPEN